jgi:S-adenosylmethionine hydrolase
MIVSFTDFSVTGPYIGQMKAKMFEIAPEENVIDLMVDAPAFNVGASAHLLAGLVTSFPKSSVFLCVVDPGVGSDRKAICVNCDDKWFVGPDNGLFSEVISSSHDAVAYEILWRPKKLSNSFHGRDLFAPVAAMLAKGQKFRRQEMALAHLQPGPKKRKHAEIIYIDNYGNCWTNLRKNQVNTNQKFVINDKKISYAPMFSATKKGEAFWYYNSSDFVEFAVNLGSAQKTLKLKIGEKVRKVKVKGKKS